MNERTCAQCCSEQAAKEVLIDQQRVLPNWLSNEWDVPVSRKFNSINRNVS
jgi:hypothetical protein